MIFGSHFIVGWHFQGIPFTCLVFIFPLPHFQNPNSSISFDVGFQLQMSSLEKQPKKKKSQVRSVIHVRSQFSVRASLITLGLSQNVVAQFRTATKGCRTRCHKSTTGKRMKSLIFTGCIRESFTAWNPQCDVETVRHRKRAFVFGASFAKSHPGLRHNGSPFHSLLLFIEMDFNHYSAASQVVDRQTVARCPLGNHGSGFPTHQNLFKGTKLWRGLCLRTWVWFSGFFGFLWSNTCMWGQMKTLNWL